jgi:predicted nucleic acid-binding protein
VIVADTNLIAYLFVVLAQDLGVPLVTSDSALIAKFKPTVVSMRVFCS